MMDVNFKHKVHCHWDLHEEIMSCIIADGRALQSQLVNYHSIRASDCHLLVNLTWIQSLRDASSICMAAP